MNREMSSSLQAIPDELFDKVLTIVDQVTETSLIASSLLHRRLVSPAAPHGRGGERGREGGERGGREGGESVNWINCER